MSEAAILSLNRNKFYVYKKENKKGFAVKSLDKVLTNKSEYISAIIILSTLINVGGSVIIGTMTSELFKVFNPIVVNTGFAKVNVNPNTLFAIIFTLLVLYISKMIPKLVGAQTPLRISLFTSPVIVFLQYFIKPVSVMSYWICKPFVSSPEDSSISMIEIKHILKKAYKDDLIKDREFEIISNSLLLNQKTVKDIMKYRNEIESFPASESIRENIEKITSFKHRRILITVGEKDEIPVGVVVVSDLMKSALNGEDKKVSDFAHKLLVVKETDTLGHILADFNDSLDHIALVEKADGKYLGMLAIEDIFDSLTLGFNNS
tara:strand:- start:2691 stop:3647 length:957 start_codon:yes stop_codon:yes gene_type:complete